MTRTERRKNPDYRIAELEAELERLREDNSAFGPITQTVREENKRLRGEKDKLEAQLALAHENTQTNGQAYEDAMDRITELEAEKEQYDLNVVAWIQAETEVERLRAENAQLRELDRGNKAEVERLEDDLAYAKEAWGHDANEVERLREALDYGTASEFARLHRIEEAAREIFRVIDSTKGAQDTRPWSNALRAALEEE